MEGWVKLHRSLIESFVFSNPTTLKIWIWILLKATKKKRFVPVKIGNGFQDVELNTGELIFGRFKAEEQLNIDGSTIYKHIHKLEESGNIILKSNSHYTIITVCNWDIYQEEENKKEQPNDSDITPEEQHRNNTVTTPEHKQESKECIKGIRKKRNNKEFIPPTLDEFKKYFTDNGYKSEVAERAFKGYDVADWHDSNGNKVKNWKQKATNVWFTDKNKIPEYQRQAKEQQQSTFELFNQP